MSKHKKVCRVLNYIEHLLILISTVNGCFSIWAFASLVCILIENRSFAVGLKFCAITGGIIKYKSMANKEKKKHNKVVLSVKSKLNSYVMLLFEV